MMRGRLGTIGKLAGGTAMALALGGCMVADYASPGYGYAPPPRASYDGPRGAAWGMDAYYPIDQADGFASAIGASPPDYSFRFDQADAWAWVGLSGELLLMERARDGDLQYYFAARSATPYLIRDGDFSYAFDGRELVAVFGPDGQMIGDGSKAGDRRTAAWLLDRARGAFAASRQRRWDNRTARSWSDSYGIDFVLNSGWGWWRGQPGWNGYSRYDDDYYARRDYERRHRHDHADRYRDWHRRGHRGSPPAYTPPVVTEVPHTRPRLGDPAGPIMSADGRDGPREGMGGGGQGGGTRPGRGDPDPVIVQPQGPIAATPVPPSIVTPSRSDESAGRDGIRRHPRPIPGEPGMERRVREDEAVTISPQSEAMQSDAARQRELGRLREIERQRAAVEAAQLREEEGRVRAEMERSRAQALEQAGRAEQVRAEREQRQAQYEQSRAWEEQRRIDEGRRQQGEQPRYEAPRVETPPPPAPRVAPRWENVAPPTPQAAPPPPPRSAPEPEPAPQPRHERPHRVDSGDERPD